MNSLNDIWSEVMRVLSSTLTPTAIKAWFSDCEPVELADNCMVISTSTSFKKEIISSRFSAAIKTALSDLFASEFDLRVLSADEVESYFKEKDGIDINIPPEMAGYTFDRFIVGNSNKMAHAAAMAVAEHPGSSYNPLFIYGNSGLGKTHLMRAIGHSIYERNPNARIAYVKGDEFTNELVSAIRNSTQEQFRAKFRNVELLLMDDIQFIAGKQQTQNEFFHTFNDIYEAGHQIVITSDRPPIEMSLLDDRLRTRFEGGLMVDIAPPDLETRMAIIRNKAAQLGLILPDEGVEYIANEITQNVRTLEGVIKRLTAYNSILSGSINMEIIKKAIRDVIHDGPYTPKPEDIIRETARYYSLSEEELRGQSKAKVISNARQISMYLMRTLTSLSLQDIGAQYENRNHSTVLSSIKKVEENINKDRDVAATVRDITSNINSAHQK